MGYNTRRRAFIGPKFDLIDNIALKIYADNELYALWVDSYARRQFNQSKDRARIEAMQNKIKQIAPDKDFDTAKKSLLWRQTERTLSEDLFVMAHPFLELYSQGDDANILLDMEKVGTLHNCLAYGTFVNFFTKTNFGKHEQPGFKIDVVYLLQQIYNHALILLDTAEMTYGFSDHFYLCCIKCKLGLVELSAEIPQRTTFDFRTALGLFLEALNELEKIPSELNDMSSIRVALNLTIKKLQEYILQNQDRDDAFTDFISNTWRTPGTTQKIVKRKLVFDKLRFV